MYQLGVTALANTWPTIMHMVGGYFICGHMNGTYDANTEQHKKDIHSEIVTLIRSLASGDAFSISIVYAKSGNHYVNGLVYDQSNYSYIEYNDAFGNHFRSKEEGGTFTILE